jgi:hypothetical protein
MQKQQAANQNGKRDPEMNIGKDVFHVGRVEKAESDRGIEWFRHQFKNATR